MDLIFTFYLFFMCLASDRVAPDETGPRVWLSSMAYRFAQIQLCIIYAFSGWEKLKGPVWWNGEALWSVIANPQMARFDFGWMVHFPLVLVGVAYLTLFWEIYFPVLIWIPRLRVVTLLIGLGFHLSIALMMKIAFFGFLMIGIYVLFLTEKEVRSVWNAFKWVPGFRRLALKNL
ncbi:MAG: HTTM domain-containing protein [Bdellovibrionales bacterium]|nr:HTTM domain-containing protein [Bdellovibrionales bacterium]